MSAVTFVRYLFPNDAVDLLTDAMDLMTSLCDRNRKGFSNVQVRSGPVVAVVGAICVCCRLSFSIENLSEPHEILHFFSLSLSLRAVSYLEAWLLTDHLAKSKRSGTVSRVCQLR